MPAVAIVPEPSRCSGRNRSVRARVMRGVAIVPGIGGSSGHNGYGRNSRATSYAARTWDSGSWGTSG
jgi:hypothetical protein